MSRQLQQFWLVYVLVSASYLFESRDSHQRSGGDIISFCPRHVPRATIIPQYSDVHVQHEWDHANCAAKELSCGHSLTLEGRRNNVISVCQHR